MLPDKQSKRDYGNIDVEWYDVCASVALREIVGWNAWIRQGLRETWKPRR